MSAPGPDRRWVLLDRVGSTSDYLREALQRGDLGEAAVLARSQDAGRGRHGRTWLSPEGGLYLSVSIPALEERRPVLHAVAAGLAVVDLLREELAIDAALKWPNDVLVDGRKISGILSELLAVGEQSWIVVGVGLNVKVLPEADGLEYTPAAVVDELGDAPTPEVARLARRIMDRLDAELRILHEQGGAPLLQRWRERAATLGQRVRVTLPRGALTGHAVGIRDDFALLVRTPAGIEAVEVGDCLHLGRSARDTAG